MEFDVMIPDAALDMTPGRRDVHEDPPPPRSSHREAEHPRSELEDTTGRDADARRRPRAADHDDRGETNEDVQRSPREQSEPGQRDDLPL